MFCRSILPISAQVLHLSTDVVHFPYEVDLWAKLMRVEPAGLLLRLA